MSAPCLFVLLLFQSTLPVWGATRLMNLVLCSILFQSTLPVWGATLVQVGTKNIQKISIHAPRVGSD